MGDDNTNEAERIEQLEQRIQQLEQQQQTRVTRRSVLSGLGIAGLGAGFGAYAGSQRASAQEGSGSIGTENNPLAAIYVDELNHNSLQADQFTDGADNTISNFVGSGLELDGQTLTAIADAEALWEEEDSETITPADPYSGIGVETVSTEEARTTGDESITIDVPSDYSTFRDAMRAATEVVQPRDGVEVVVNIESGHEIQNGISLNNGSYTYIRVSAEDPVVNANLGTGENLMSVIHGGAPKWDCVVDMGGLARDGLTYHGSYGVVEEDAGVRNAGRMGIQVQSGRVRAEHTDFSGAEDQCAQVTEASIAYLQGADLTDCGGRRALYCSRGSYATVIDADVSGANDYGILARRSIVEGQDLIADNIGGFAIRTELGSVVRVNGLESNNVGSDIVRADHASTIHCRNANISGSDNRGLRAEDTSTIYAEGITISDLGQMAVTSRNMSRVSAPDANISNVNQTTGSPIVTTLGSQINVNGAVVDGSDVSTAHTNVSDFNAIDNDSGIIWA